MTSYGKSALTFGDRHCNCVYYHDWQRTKKARPPNENGMLANVMRADTTSPRNTLTVQSGKVVAVGEPLTPAPITTLGTTNMSTLPFDEEAKLVYGVLISLRNMIKKLAGRWVSPASVLCKSFNLIELVGMRPSSTIVHRHISCTSSKLSADTSLSC